MSPLFLVIPSIRPSAPPSPSILSPKHNPLTMSSISIDPAESEDIIASKLLPLYVQDTAKFEKIVARIYVQSRSTKPRFPPVTVASVAPVPPADVPAFKAEHIDDTYLHWNDAEAQKRVEKVRKHQYFRWRWACDNVETYVNVLRVAGHSDAMIQNMFDGTPMCFRTPEAYADLRRALGVLKGKIEKEMGWENVDFVITGSSVPGFSQNPCKGLADRPTRITDISSSDVDICIVAEGVNKTMMGRMARGEKEPKSCYSTTCSATTQATRFGCKDLSPVCQAVDDFKKEWDGKLEGGVQITFGEDDNPTPPWEARIDTTNFE